MSALQDVRIISLPKLLDERGNLSFIEGNRHVPFSIRRTYWIYDVPGGEIRGSHAYRKLNEFIIALSGSFDVVLHDGTHEKTYFLNRSYYGLLVPSLLWRTLQNFSTNAVCLIAASDYYDEHDYIRDFKEFKDLAARKIADEVSISPEKTHHLDQPTDFRSTSVYDCPMLELPRVRDRAGNITAIECLKNLPFPLSRLYYLYDIPGGEARGGHAHKALYQLVVAASGSFDILLDDGINKKIVNLNRSYYGILIKPGIWRELINFSSGAICLVLASDYYDPADYIRDYEKFANSKKHG